MAKSYYGQSKRPVVEGINWGQIGTDLTTKLNEEVKRREDLKVEIDQASNDYLRTVQDTPQGQNVGANQRMAAFADNASIYMLDLDKKLKAGQIRLRDYNAMRANLQQGTTDMFGISKKFNANFENDMLRASTIASKLEVRNNAKLQEFSNPSASDIVIDPITGQLSVVKMIEVDDGKGGKIRVPSSDSNDISSIFSLQNKQNQKIDKFDTKKFGEDAAKSFDNRYLTSINKGNVGTRDSILENPLFASAKYKYIKAALEPTYAAQSILADGSGDYEYSENIEDKGKKGIIVLIPDPNNPNSGVLVPDLTKDQEDEAYDILNEQFMARLGYAETTKTKGKEVKPASTLLKDYSSWVNSRIDVPLSINETDAKNQLDNAFAGLGFNITETNRGVDELTITSPDGAVLVLDLELENSLDIVNSFINLNTPVNTKGVLYTSGEIPKSSTANPSFGEWKKQNPNGTLAEYSKIYYPSK